MPVLPFSLRWRQMKHFFLKQAPDFAALGDVIGQPARVQFQNGNLQKWFQCDDLAGPVADDLSIGITAQQNGGLHHFPKFHSGL